MISKKIKVLCMGLHQHYLPTGIVKGISIILCHLFRCLYGKSLGSISIWSSERLLWITHSNYYICVSHERGGGLYMKKPRLMVTGVFLSSDLVECPVIP